MFRISKDKRENRLRLSTDNEDLEDLLNLEWSCPNPGARFSPWAETTLSPISTLGSFQTGLAIDILKWVKKKFPNEKLIIDEEIRDRIKPNFNINELKQPNNTTFKLRHYQEKTVNLALKYGRGTFELCTSAGKSLIIHSLIENIWESVGHKNTCLILVPNIQLVKQFHGDLIEYGIGEENVCMFSSFSKDLKDVPIIISNRQYIQNHKARLPNIDVLIVDEAHMLKQSNNASQYVAGLSTQNKFAFTGTLPEDPMDRWNVLGLCGSVLYELKSHELQEEGTIAQTNITTIAIEHGEPQPECEECEDPLEKAKARFPLEWKFIESSLDFNEFLSKWCLNLEGNTIVLFDHIEHGEYFKSVCEAFNKEKKLFFVNGSIELEYREDVRKEMEKSDDCVLLAQVKTFGTGVSIKNVSNIVFAFSAGKSVTKVLQAVGRGLRLKEGKTEMFLYDFYHNFKYSKSHYDKRRSLYLNNYNSKTFKEIEYNLKTNKSRKL
jgi:superfamily II DNA or RNA helicase